MALGEYLPVDVVHDDAGENDPDCEEEQKQNLPDQDPLLLSGPFLFQMMITFHFLTFVNKIIYNFKIVLQ